MAKFSAVLACYQNVMCKSAQQFENCTIAFISAFECWRHKFPSHIGFNPSFEPTYKCDIKNYRYGEPKLLFEFICNTRELVIKCQSIATTEFVWILMLAKYYSRDFN